MVLLGMELCTYRPAAEMADGVLDHLIVGVTEKDTGIGKVLVGTGVAVVGIHGELVMCKVAKPRCSKKMLR